MSKPFVSLEANPFYLRLISQLFAKRVGLVLRKSSRDMDRKDCILKSMNSFCWKPRYVGLFMYALFTQCQFRQLCKWHITASHLCVNYVNLKVHLAHFLIFQQNASKFLTLRSRKRFNRFKKIFNCTMILRSCFPNFTFTRICLVKIVDNQRVEAEVSHYMRDDFAMTALHINWEKEGNFNKCEVWRYARFEDARRFRV